MSNASLSRTVTPPAGTDRRSPTEQYLTRALPSLRAICSRFITPERLVKIALVARVRDPKLARVSPESLLLALMSAAELGLEPNTALQHAALVPFRNKHTGQYEAEYWPMYRGLIELGRRCLGIRSARSVPIYVDDPHEIIEGIDRRLTHVPNLASRRRGSLEHVVVVYSIAEVKGGVPEWTYMTRDEILDVKHRARASHDGPWVTDEMEMAKKTVLRRLMKQLPLSPEGQAFLAHDEAQTGDPDEAQTWDALMSAQEARAKLEASADGNEEPVSQPEPDSHASADQDVDGGADHGAPVKREGRRTPAAGVPARGK